MVKNDQGRGMGRPVPPGSVRVSLPDCVAANMRARAAAAAAARRAALERLELDGIPPCPAGEEWTAGGPALSFSLRWPPGEAGWAEVRVHSASPDGCGREPAWGRAWPGYGERLDAAALLALAASGLPGLVGPVPSTLDFVSGTGRTDLPPLAVANDGAGTLSLVTRHGTDAPSGAGAPLLLALRDLGGLLRRGLAAEAGPAASAACAAWDDALAAAGLPPPRWVSSPAGHPPPDTDAGDAAFYAGRFGCSPPAYVSTASWLAARAVLRAAREPGFEGDFGWAGFLPYLEMGGVPPDAEVTAMVARASALSGVAAADFSAAALARQNAMALDAAFPPPRPPLPPAAA